MDRDWLRSWSELRMSLSDSLKSALPNPEMCRPTFKQAIAKAWLFSSCRWCAVAAIPLDGSQSFRRVHLRTRQLPTGVRGPLPTDPQ